MTGKIKLLDVGDGDAIIVHLNKGKKDLVIVIDGGQTWNYEEIVKPALCELLNQLNKSAPDIVVATHYDSDHIGGLIPLVSDYIDGIKEVWVYRTPQLTTVEQQILESSTQLTNLKSQTQSFFENDIVNEYPTINEEAIKEKSNFIIESLNQLETFLGLIPKEKVRQVYHGDSFKEWPELKVLGPTKDYFDSIFSTNKKLKDLIVEETIDYLDENIMASKKRMNELMAYNLSPCQFLKSDGSAKLTPTNKVSLIIAIDKNDQRFLFTGDAGIESFKSIPSWTFELKDLHWLKVPHHGSDNNISTEIIEVMKPEFADNSGDKYQNNNVIDCISNNPRARRTVRSTKNTGNIDFEI